MRVDLTVYQDFPLGDWMLEYVDAQGVHYSPCPLTWKTSGVKVRVRREVKPDDDG